MKALLFHRETSLPRSVHSREKIRGVPPRKDYLRFPQIALPEGGEPEVSLAAALQSRISALDFTGADAPGLQDIATLLSLSIRRRESGEEGGPMRRPHPSGGACYPLEVYLATADMNGACGLFHYAPARHVLEHLFPNDDGKALFERIRDGFADPWKSDVPAYLLISAVWGRTTRKYGEFGYRLTLFEAGHAAQNILLCASALGLRHRPTAGVDTAIFEEILGVRDDEETLLYAVALGDGSVRRRHP